MTSGGSDSIFNDEKGHADQILKDLAGLIWLAEIYGIDPGTYPEWTMYETNLNGLAEAIVAGHSD